MSALELELKTYQSLLPTLIGKDDGKFALIKGEELVGVYDSYPDALKIGYEKFGVEPFLVKKISAAEQVGYFTRDIQPCPA
ncbi:MAG: hypothetical protein KIS79_07860 [Burkholderiales bacterium]|nr:hypothetical protein [Burkholderiales bacterium]